MGTIRTNRTGEKWKNGQNQIFEIIEYFGVLNCTIKFEDGTILKNINYHKAISGILNPNFKSVYNTGFIGIGKYNSGNKQKCFKLWLTMLRRCYNKEFHLIKPTYRDCSVDERWHNFQVFAEWYEQNYIEDFHLDKDILVKGNKVYGPDTCCFVPQEINKLFIKAENSRGNTPIGVSKVRNRFSVNFSKQNEKTKYLGTFDTIQEAFNEYKFHKEKHIKSVANLWKDSISDNVYNAMYNYTVEITD